MLFIVQAFCRCLFRNKRFVLVVKMIDYCLIYASPLSLSLSLSLSLTHTHTYTHTVPGFDDFVTNNLVPLCFSTLTRPDVHVDDGQTWAALLEVSSLQIVLYEKINEPLLQYLQVSLVGCCLFVTAIYDIMRRCVHLSLVLSPSLSPSLSLSWYPC